MPNFSLNDLEAIVAARAAADPAESWTAKLLAGGIEKAARKFGEEAVETVVAALREGDDALRDEAADVLYHLLVVLKARGVPLANVMAELERRTRQSGIAEKSARQRIESG